MEYLEHLDWMEDQEMLDLLDLRYVCDTLLVTLSIASNMLVDV